MMTTLALTDGWIVSLAVGQLLINAGLTLALYFIAQRTKQIETLKRDLGESATRRIDEKFGSVVNQFTSAIDKLTGEISRIDKRLERGEAEFRNVQGRDHDIEIRLLQAVNDTRQYVRDHCATRDSVQKLFEKFEELRVAQAAGRHG
jgi:hypothetical protein